MTLQTARPEENRSSTSRTRKIVAQFWRWDSGDFCPVDSWLPAINVYQLQRRIEVCVDLAGLDPKSIDVRAAPGKLTIQGIRVPPEPRHDREAMRIVTMEINHGPFCRMIPLPEHVELHRIDTRYANGLLWVTLPLRDQG